MLWNQISLAKDPNFRAYVFLADQSIPVIIIIARGPRGDYLLNLITIKMYLGWLVPKKKIQIILISFANRTKTIKPDLDLHLPKSNSKTPITFTQDVDVVT